MTSKKYQFVISDVAVFTQSQWRNNKACSERGPSAVGGPKFA